MPFEIVFEVRDQQLLAHEFGFGSLVRDRRVQVAMLASLELLNLLFVQLVRIVDRHCEFARPHALIHCLIVKQINGRKHQKECAAFDLQNA